MSIASVVPVGKRPLPAAGSGRWRLLWRQRRLRPAVREQADVAVEGEVPLPTRSIPLLLDDERRHAAQFVVFTMEKTDVVGVLFQAARFTEVGQLRALVRSE